MNGKRTCPHYLFVELCKNLGFVQSQIKNLSYSMEMDLRIRNGDEHLPEFKNKENVLADLPKSLWIRASDLNDKLIPRDGSMSSIGLLYQCESSYAVLVREGDGLAKGEWKNIAGYNVRYPKSVCEVTTITSEEYERKCPCCNHLALYAAIKRGIEKWGTNEEAIRAEVDKWIYFLFPTEILREYFK